MTRSDYEINKVRRPVTSWYKHYRRNKFTTIDSPIVDKEVYKRRISVRSNIRKKMVSFEKIINEGFNESGTVECIKNAKRTFVIENYRQKRLKRTEKILNQIDTTDPFILKLLYNYKLNSVLSLEEDKQEIKERINKLLNDPNRLVVRMERRRMKKTRNKFA